MTGSAFIIWLHGLAALLFGGAFVAGLRRPDRSVTRWLLLIALGASALWALSVAGIGDGEGTVGVTMALRNLAWIAALFALSAGDVDSSRWRVGVYGAVVACVLLAGIVGLDTDAVAADTAQRPIETIRLVLRLLSTIGALVLLQHHVSARRGRWSEAAAMFATAMAIMWASDLIVLAVAYVAGIRAEWLTVARGMATLLVAASTMIAVHRKADRALSISRAATAQAIIVAGGALYVVAATAITGLLGEVGGAHARVFQAAFVVGTGTALFTLLTTPWLRAWSKVMIAKHLYSHRYDYRGEWMRFTDTLGVSGHDVPVLEYRVVKAMADLTGSPAAMLLCVAGDELVPGTAWRWDEAPPSGATTTLADHLTRTTRIIDLDACRAGAAPAEEIAAIPSWLIARTDAWALVPLLRADALVGAVVLAHPPVPRALDWEDFDLLGAAGRQAASYLAEERAHAALADAQRFDEFNRRFAFIMHDLKNLVSQTALVARNAERHADNPAFRADMIATLRDTSQRMTALLARLSQHGGVSGNTVRPLDLLAFARTIAAARGAQHPVEVGGASAWALADPQALRTLIDHLLQNAIEASAPQQAVRLHVEGDSRTATISVIDLGCGMSAAFVRDQLFRPFVSMKPAGFGLGAYEARQMAERMGGTITVTTEEGAGSCFRVVMPVAAPLASGMGQAA